MSGSRFIVRCAWCGVVRTAAGWSEEQLSEVEAHAFAAHGGEVSHGVCPRCFHRVAPEGSRYPPDEGTAP